MVDEANLETHGIWGQLVNDPLWHDAYLERADRMVARDRNHAAIIIWSMGNEAGLGVNIEDMATHVRAKDTSGRLIHYECRVSEGDQSPSPLGDIIANMYVSRERMVELSNIDPSRPVILCEVRSFFFWGGGGGGGGGK